MGFRRLRLFVCAFLARLRSSGGLLVLLDRLCAFLARLPALFGLLPPLSANLKEGISAFLKPGDDLRRHVVYLLPHHRPPYGTFPDDADAPFPPLVLHDVPRVPLLVARELLYPEALV